MAHHRDEWVVWAMIGFLIIFVIVIAAYINTQIIPLYLDMKKETNAIGEIRK